MDRGAWRLMSMAKKPRQLSLDELHRLKWLLGGVLALFSVWTVFYLDLDAWTLLLVDTAGILVVLIWPGLPARIPAWVHKAAFPVIVAIFLGDLWLHAQEILPPMVHLDLMLIFYRGTSYRQRRDDLQLIILGLFLVVVAGVITVSLAFAVQIIAFTACALLLMFVITLVDAAEATDPPARTPLFTWAGPAITPAWMPRTSWRELWHRLKAVTDWRVVLLSAALFAGVVGVSVLLFLVIPRFQLENNLFLDRFISKKAKTGFSDNIKFGDVTDISEDTSLALSIDIPNPGEVPVPLYLRMVVLDDYHNGTFRLSRELRSETFLREQSTTTVLGTERGPSPQSAWVFYFESGVSPYLPLPGSFHVLRFTEKQNVFPSVELRSVELLKEPVTMVAYRLEGVNPSATLVDAAFAGRFKKLREQANADSGLSQLKMQLALPFTDPGDTAILRQAVEAITGHPLPAAGGVRSAGVPASLITLSAAEFAGRACAWLAAHHRYSLRSSIPPGAGDPLTKWMNSAEAGHCELFAGALVVLARTAGLPAHVVSGFKTGTLNGFSNDFTIRNSEAHAWCEVWDDRAGGWLRVDPTPGAVAVDLGGPQNPQDRAVNRLDRSWSARLNSLRVFWYRRIVNFDQSSQADTLRAMKAATRQSGLRFRAVLDNWILAGKRWLLSPWNLRRAAMIFAAAAVLTGLAWASRKLARGWRWRSRRRGEATRLDPVRVEAGRWLERFSGGEIEPEPRLVVLELQRLRYGARESWPEPALVFRRARTVWRETKRKRKPRVETSARG